MLPRSTSAKDSLRRLRSGGSPWWCLFHLSHYRRYASAGLNARGAVAGHFAHPRGGTAALAVDALGILTARHLQTVARAGELHVLHRARGDELEHGTASADQIRRSGQRLNRRHAAGDGERDLWVLRPE